MNATSTNSRPGPAVAPVASPAPRAWRWAALGVIYLVWGSTYLAIRVMVETIPPLLGAGVRFLIAGALLSGWVLARSGRTALRIPARPLLAVAATAMLLVVGGPGLTTVAERSVPSGLAALLVASVPLWVVLWSVAFRESVAHRTLKGAAVGLAGVAVLVLPGAHQAPQPAASGIGVVLLLVVAASHASGSVLSGRLRGPWSLPADRLAVSAVQMLLGGAVLAAAGLLAGETKQLDLVAVAPSSLWALAYLIGPGSLLAYTAYVWLLAHAPVSQVATYAYVNPVVAVVLGWLVLNENVSSRTLLGAALTVTAVITVISTSPQKH